MANLLESSQNQQTVAPDYYNNYLANVATAGTNAAAGAKFADATELQKAAFQNVDTASTAFQPTLTTAGNTLQSATDVTSPLSAANPYLTSAVSDPSVAAQSYMTPYIQSVVNNLGDVGARNIRQNLAPLATSAAVGSGQFGSKRGAEVLGQTISNADRDILNAQSTALNTGYQNALNAAISQNQIENQAGATAANAAGTGQSNLINAGAQQGQLATTNQNLNLGAINALSTIGAQQQQINQNRENFPLTNTANLAALMRGYTIPTSTKTTMQASPLATLAGAATGTAGFFQKQYDKAGNPIADSAPFDALVAGGKGLATEIGDLFKPGPTSKPSGTATGNDAGSTDTAGVYTNTKSPTGYVDMYGDPVDANGNPYNMNTGTDAGLNYPVDYGTVDNYDPSTDPFYYDRSADYGSDSQYYDYG